MTTRAPFDAATLPLTGVRVIEASAGTGKTYSLIALFLRSIGERGLRCEDVLMVTFTEAATADLRRRLDVALRRLVAPQRLPIDDPDEPYAALLASMLAQVGDAALLRARLQLAAQSLDQASIQTIHAFCRRALRECAFEADSELADAEPGAQRALWAEATRDWWQQRTFAASPADVVRWQRKLVDPKTRPSATAALQAIVMELSPLPDSALRPADVAPRARDAQVDAAAALASVRAHLDDASLAAARAVIDGTHGLSVAKADGYPPARVDEAFASLVAWRAAAAAADDVSLPDAALCLAADRLASRMGKRAKTPAPDHALFTAIGRACAALNAHDALAYAAFLRDAVDGIRAIVHARQSARGCIGFEDLIDRLATALTDRATGARLADALRRRHPLALVDEFQDTDPKQYAIFRAIYAGRDDAGLVLIGDPKQAIYRFRGGDVYAYRQALDDSRGDVRTLGVNRRSDARLVAAINALFGAVPAPFRLDFVPFVPVDALPALPDRAWRDDARGDAAIAWLVDEKMSQEQLERRGVDACADEIVRLIADGRAGRVMIGDRPVDAADIAVLAPTHLQVELMRAALGRRGVRVAAIARDSVLATRAADDLAAWLAAFAAPGDARALRAALASPAIGADAAMLADAAVLDVWATRFSAAAVGLRERGVLAATWPLLQACAPAMLSRPDGARDLAHLRHLAEWLAVQQPGPREAGALRAFFTRRREAPDAGDAGEAIRPQDDGARVRVMTVHASKGLEFGCVFLPFAWRGARESPRRPLRWHGDDGALIVDLAADGGDAEARARQEEHDEDVRLAYVALTRAIHRVYVVFADNDSAARSGIGQVLATCAGDAPLAQRWRAAVGDAWTIAPLPASSPDVVALPASRVPDVSAAPSPGTVWPRWVSHSFSSLHHQADADALPVADHDEWPVLREDDDGDVALSRHEAAAFGDAFHELMEALVAPSPRAEARDLGAQATQVAQRHGLAPARRDELERFARATLATDLAPGHPLGALAPADRIVEMPFAFALGEGGIARVAATLRGDASLAAVAATLSGPLPRTAGQMRGYVDLVARVDGRYHVLDYKTNRLVGADAYAPDGLARAMREHGYDLQALIYTVALHRHLRVTLGDRYAPARDLGGAIYLFVRGHAAAGQGIHRVAFAPALIDALDHAFGEAEVAR